MNWLIYYVEFEMGTKALCAEYTRDYVDGATG